MGADIYGKWAGSYSYDQSEIWGRKAPGDVPFEIILEKNWWGGFKGTVQDDVSKGGHPMDGKIRGRMNGNKIRFKKAMPKLHFLYPSGQNAFAPGIQIIHYSGHLNIENQVFEGIWEIESNTFRLEDQNVQIARTTGTWRMARKQ